MYHRGAAALIGAAERTWSISRSRDAHRPRGGRDGAGRHSGGGGDARWRASYPLVGARWPRWSKGVPLRVVLEEQRTCASATADRLGERAVTTLAERLDWGLVPAVPVPFRGGDGREAQRGYARWMAAQPVAGVAVWAHTGRGPHLSAPNIAARCSRRGGRRCPTGSSWPAPATSPWPSTPAEARPTPCSPFPTEDPVAYHRRLGRELPVHRLLPVRGGRRRGLRRRDPARHPRAARGRSASRSRPSIR